MSDLPSSPEGESRSLYEEHHQPRFRPDEGAAPAQQFYIDSENRLVTTEDNRLTGSNRMTGNYRLSSDPAVVTYAELEQVVKREENPAGLEVLELDSFLQTQGQVRPRAIQFQVQSHSSVQY